MVQIEQKTSPIQLAYWLVGFPKIQSIRHNTAATGSKKLLDVTAF
jgi:hypothetical protein